MRNTLNQLIELLQEVPEYMVDGRLNKDLIAELARKYDLDLLNKLLSDSQIKRSFFVDSNAGPIFKKDIFIQFISQKAFLPDSYTMFAQKIGLAVSSGTNSVNNLDTLNGNFATANTDLLSDDRSVVLNWPYKDCLLEGGQDKTDAKRNEVFFNEILAPDEITTLLEDKVFVNWKRHDETGEHELDELKPNDNLIIKGNNLVVLYSLKKRFAGKIKLIYIDPPFNTGGDSFSYNDKFNHSTWLTFMRNRFEVARDLLADDGAIFVHLDYNEAHYAKVLMDEIFGREMFRNEVIWAYGAGGNPKDFFPRKHDTILFYAKKNQNDFHKDSRIMRVPYDESTLNTHFKKTDAQGRRYRVQKVNGREYVAYADEGKLVTDVWTDIGAQNATSPISTEYTGFNGGQKPEKLLQRIITAVTQPGDIVLDYHLGSGTTASVAHKMGRQYIGIEQLYYGEQDSITRLQKVIAGDQGGVSKDVSWTGGGSFVSCNVKNDANKFREEIHGADKTKTLELLKQALNSSFLSYRIDPAKVSEKEFKKLSLANQKRILADLIDNNTLYLNYSEINDATHEISDADKRHNREFYGE